MNQYNRSHLPVAAILMGKYNSYFADKMLPDSIDTSGFRKTGASSRILAAGNASFIMDDFANQNNATFFANVLDWMAQEKGLIEIRSKILLPDNLRSFCRLKRYNKIYRSATSSNSCDPDRILFWRLKRHDMQEFNAFWGCRMKNGKFSIHQEELK